MSRNGFEAALPVLKMVDALEAPMNRQLDVRVGPNNVARILRGGFFAPFLSRESISDAPEHLNGASVPLSEWVQDFGFDTSIVSITTVIARRGLINERSRTGYVLRTLASGQVSVYDFHSNQFVRRPDARYVNPPESGVPLVPVLLGLELGTHSVAPEIYEPRCFRVLEAIQTAVEAGWQPSLTKIDTRAKPA